jgi:hypothetical protein
MAAKFGQRIAMRTIGFSRSRLPAFQAATRFALITCVCAGSLLIGWLGAKRASGATADTWMGGVGTWTSLNWSVMSPPGYPSNTDPITYNVFIAGSPVPSDVLLSTAVIVDNLTVFGGNILDVTGGEITFALADPGAGTIANAGVIKLEGGGTIALDGGGLPASFAMASLTGAGAIVMSPGSLITGKTDVETLTSTNSILGAGTISGLSLINNGTINANVPGGPTLMISPSTAPTSTGVSNFSTGAPGSGMLEATGGGTLALGFGTFDNNAPAPGTMPGTIAALGGTVTLGSAGATTIKGGTLMTTGPDSPIVNLGTATLNGVAISPLGSTYNQGDFTTTNLEGAITNDGGINVLSSGHGMSVLNLDAGDVTLSGGGTINLLGFAVPLPNPNAVQIWGVGGARLTVGAGQTIMGSGQIGTHSTALSPKLTNHGTITATTFPSGGPIPQGITIFPKLPPAGMPPIADAVINDGTIAASDNSFLTFNGGVVTNSGPGGPGTISASSMGLPSTVTLQGGVTVNGGKIILDGFASQLQLNNATARPDMLMNSTGGTITTVASSTANILGGTITNPAPGFIVVTDNSALTMDNAERGGSVTNSGIIQVGTGGPTGPATLTINQGSLTNDMGEIDVASNGVLNLVGVPAISSTINGGVVGITDAGGTIALNNGTIHGGTLNIPAGGLVTTVNGSVTNYLGGTVNNFFNGTIQVVANSRLYLEAGGTYMNAGTIFLNGAAGNPASLRPSGVGGNVSLTGSGIVNLAGDGINNLIIGDSGERLINVDNTIIGGGLIDGSDLSLTNKVDGVISATLGAGITINSGPLGVINGGTIKTGGATLNLMKGTFTNFDGANLGTIAADPGDQLNLTGGVIPAIINGGIVNVNKDAGNSFGTLNLSSGTIHGGTLNNFGMINSLAGPVSALGGTVNNNGGATIDVNAGAMLDLETTGTYNNSGLISINAAPGSTLRVNGANGTATLNGRGNVTLLGAGSSITGANGNETLVNQNNTINGGGNIGAGALALTNRGTISADNAIVKLTIQPNPTGVTNSGTIKTAGGNLVLTGGTFTNFEGANLGTIAANPGDQLDLIGGVGAPAVIKGGIVKVNAATLNLSNATIHAGNVNNIAGGTIDSLAGFFNTLGGTVDNNGGSTIDVNAGAMLDLETTGTYNNSGLISINAAPGSTLRVNGANGTATLNGLGGSVTLQGAGSSILGANASETLLNQTNTINGGGAFGAGSLAITNRSLVSATNGAVPLTILPNASGLTNSNTIQAAGGLLMFAGGTISNFEGATDGTIQTAGNGDMLTVTGDAVINGGNVVNQMAGTINLSNGTIHGGTLNNSATGIVTTTIGDVGTLGGTVNNPAGGVISAVANSTLMLETGGIYNNSGAITISEGPPGSPSALQLDGYGGTVNLSGGGTVTMVAGAGGGNSISGVNGNERLINLDNAINGAGRIGLHMMSLTNDGTINADAAPGIIISPNSGGVINGGILKASNGATLTLDGGSYTNTIGVIQAKGIGLGSEVDLQSGVTINGGNLKNDPGDLIRVVDEAVLNTLTNKGNIAQNEGSVLDLVGTITNNGTITMPALHSVTQIKLLSGDVTLGGSGTLSMINSPLNQIVAANGLDRLAIGPNETIHGTGNVGVGMMALTNGGTIIADQTTPLTIQPNMSGFLNTGTLRAAAGSTLNVIGGYTQTAGDTNVLGTLNVTSGPLTAGGGTLSGSGTSNISEGFNLTGAFTKLDSGTTTISGPQSFASGTTLNVNGGTLQFNVTSGAVSVGTGVTATVASGATLDLAGSVSALSSGTMRVNITNNSTAPGVLVTGTNQQVGAIDGSGSVVVNAGSDLRANRIIQNALTINGNSTNLGLVTIAASDASGNSLVQMADGPSFLSVAASANSAAATMNSAVPFNDVMAPTAQLAGGPGGVLSVQQSDLPLGGASAFSPAIAVVPEPATLLLAIGAFAFLVKLRGTRHSCAP